MPDPVNLTGEIATAIDGAALRGHQLALAYVRDDGSPSVSFRGSTYVRSSTELAIWARKRDSVVVDVDSVVGASANGFFQPTRG